MGIRPDCCQRLEREVELISRRNERQQLEIALLQRELEAVNQRIQAIEETCCDE